MDETDLQINIPSHFLCPISLHLMKDPVTLSTGITYDRNNIEKWLFSFQHKTCPVTKQTLLQTDLNNNLTPNHTLRRLIQSWCTLNASFGVERIPTPKSPIDRTMVLKLINEAKKFPDTHLSCIVKLRSIVVESERNKKCLESAGAVEFLASTMKNNSCSISVNEAAIEVLFHINPSEVHIKNLINNESIQFIESLFNVMKHGSYQSRGYATMLLKSAFEVCDPIQLIGVKKAIFEEVIRVLSDKISQQATKAALKLLVELLPWGRNRIKAVEGGAVLVLIELLFDLSERRVCELVLIGLDQLCGCAEGRAELLNHGAGIAIVSKKILRVSHVVSDRGVRILSSICRYSANSRVLHEMLQVGGVSKLCLVLQVDSNLKTKEKAKEILKLHSGVWKNSSCIPVPLLSSYP